MSGRVVVDQNVLISALLYGGDKPRQVLDLIVSREYQLVSSRYLWHELEELLTTRLGMAPEVANEAIGELVRAAVHVDPDLAKIPQVCRDPDDDFILAVAAEGGANWIVTGDLDLRVLGSYCGVEIVTPARFLEVAARERKINELRHDED